MHFQNNRIDSLADGTFHELKQLTILLLENNLIRKLGPIFPTTPTLPYLSKDVYF